MFNCLKIKGERKKSINISELLRIRKRLGVKEREDEEKEGRRN